MLENKQAKIELFTFGANQLSERLKATEKQKFPFRKNIKSKKLSTHQLLVSQQRRTNSKQAPTDQSRHNSNLKNKLMLCLDSQDCGSNRKISENQQNQSTLQNTKYRSCQKNKGVLPKIFQVRSTSNKKRVISSDVCFRYDNKQPKEPKSIRQFQVDKDSENLLLFSSEQVQKNGNRPKSMMYLSEDLGHEIFQHKHRTIPQKRSLRGHKYMGEIKSVNLRGIDRKILENISELKKIYSSD